MLILLAILLAVVIVMIMIMLGSVYQMNRDFHRKIGELVQKYAMLEHKVNWLERKLMDSEDSDEL